MSSRTSSKALLAVGATTLSLLLAIGCSSGSGHKTKASPKPSLPSGMTVGDDVVGEGTNLVLFEASGTGTADIAYLVATYQNQENGVTLPWKKSVRTSVTPVKASVLVVGKDQTVSCKLTINGKVAQEVKADPGQTMVTCQAS
jgi:hypothetical protein